MDRKHQVSKHHEIADAVRLDFETSEVANNVAAMFDPDEYEAYLKSHLPSRVLMRLQKELAVFSETIKAQLAVIVQEESSETLKAYVRQKNEDKTELLSESVNTPPELPVLDEDFLKSISMFGDEGVLDFEFVNADAGFNAGGFHGFPPPPCVAEEDEPPAPPEPDALAVAVAKVDPMPEGEDIADTNEPETVWPPAPTPAQPQTRRV
ncbi:hypothetical protein CGLO_08732 [Colletotrichum gloeosporioides Cg-14]|uniref:Uncharacterized protein n=1 Tax=Colletotrichum gloeosporioides (strain Cg-14) TaxID=1237896 RepID=T0KFF2_COLGC|nr:hypothetical protein CGLO_08732 [Colletotrichum gloeosporioides Cg-14]